MDGWMDGWVGGWIDGWMEGWMDGWTTPVSVPLWGASLRLLSALTTPVLGVNDTSLL